MTEIHEKYMRRCIQLAKNGLGKTYPNPLVGSVIIWNDKIIGEGWHQQSGKPHAEVNAIRSVKNPEKLKDSTMYVSLEPCSHYGKTPPCSDLIIQHQIKKVVIGTTDPNPQVAGEGIKKLKAHGLRVETGILEEECKDLNKRFFTFQTQKRPYVILKWAQTQDGFIAPASQEIGKPIWISNAYSKQLVHKWRSEEQSILVGLNTALKDNPQLNTRLWEGENPTRILIDKDLKSLSYPDLHLLDQKIETIIFCKKPQKNQENLIFEGIDFHKDIPEQILARLYEHDLQSIIIEGGQKTLQAFIDANLWDEARVFTGSSYFKDGIKAPYFPHPANARISVNQDLLQVYEKG